MSAPKFTAQTVNNQQIDLEQLQGKVVLLAFFEHT
jgi:peroxiredoxin